MNSEEITNQLQAFVSAEDFSARSAELVEDWTARKVGLEVIEPILRFMEENPSIEFGSPGALVHFWKLFTTTVTKENLSNQSIGSRHATLFGC